MGDDGVFRGWCQFINSVPHYQYLFEGYPIGVDALTSWYPRALNPNKKAQPMQGLGFMVHADAHTYGYETPSPWTRWISVYRRRILQLDRLPPDPRLPPGPSSEICDRSTERPSMACSYLCFVPLPRCVRRVRHKRNPLHVHFDVYRNRIGSSRCYMAYMPASFTLALPDQLRAW